MTVKPSACLRMSSKWRCALGVERILSPEGHLWDQFFKAGPAVSDDFLAERASQTQAERDDL